MKISVLKSNKLNSKLVIDGYSYHFHSKNKNDSFRWSCSKRKMFSCKSCVVTKKIGDDEHILEKELHNHNHDNVYARESSEKIIKGSKCDNAGQKRQNSQGDFFTSSTSNEFSEKANIETDQITDYDPLHINSHIKPTFETKTTDLQSQKVEIERVTVEDDIYSSTYDNSTTNLTPELDNEENFTTKTDKIENMIANKKKFQSISERTKEDYFIFGRSIATQLQAIPDSYSRSVAKLKIQQILFEAETGYYKKDLNFTSSVKIHENNSNI